MKSSGDFHFKQFSVMQERSAMKIGTDGVILGAWADVDGAKSAIDVGAGTGLIALMLAQRGVELVTAVEIDPEAAHECHANVAASPWPDRIAVDHANFLEYSHEPVDLIVSNPPFYTETLHSPDRSRAVARHSDSLPLGALLRACAAMLTDDGRLALILPATRQEEVLLEGTLVRLYPRRLTLLNDYPGRQAKRILVELAKVSSPLQRSTLTIREHAGGPLTSDFHLLTRDFYLD